MYYSSITTDLCQVLQVAKLSSFHCQFMASDNFVWDELEPTSLKLNAVMPATNLTFRIHNQTNSSCCIFSLVQTLSAPMVLVYIAS